MLNCFSRASLRIIEYAASNRSLVIESARIYSETRVITASTPFRIEYIVELRASINHDVDRYVKQTAVLEAAGKGQEGAYEIGHTALKDSADRNERIHVNVTHGDRERRVTYYHKRIKSDPRRAGMSLRFEPGRDRSISTPSRRKTNDRVLGFWVDDRSRTPLPR